MTITIIAALIIVLYIYIYAVVVCESNYFIISTERKKNKMEWNS